MRKMILLILMGIVFIALVVATTQVFNTSGHEQSLNKTRHNGTGWIATDNDTLQELDIPDTFGFDTSDLILYFKLNDEDGDAEDETGKHNGTGVGNGVLPNATGKLNTGYSFAGTDDYIIIDSNSFTDDWSTYNFSIGVWFNWTGLTQANDDCFLRREAGGGTARNWLCIDSSDNNCPGNNELYTFIGGVIGCGGDMTSAIGTWHHTFLTYQTGGTKRLYFDGVLVNTSSGVEEGATGDFYISTISFDLDGVLDEFIIFNKTLTPTEISILYNRTKDKFFMGTGADQPNTIFFNDTAGTYNNITWVNNSVAGMKVNVSYSINTTGSYTDCSDSPCTIGLAGNNITIKAKTPSNATETTLLYNLTLDLTESGGGVPDATDPTVTLNEPADNFIRNGTTSTVSVDFNCTAYDNINLTNITFYWNYTGSFIANGTDTTVINNTKNTFTRNMINQSVIWNCYACDNSSNCAFAGANYTFTYNESTIPTDSNITYINISTQTCNTTETFKLTGIINCSGTENCSVNWGFGTNSSHCSFVSGDHTGTNLSIGMGRSAQLNSTWVCWTSIPKTFHLNATNSGDAMNQSVMDIDCELNESITEEEKMDLTMVLGLGIVAFLFLFFAFQLNQDHFFLKIILIFFTLMTVLVIPTTIISGYANTADTFMKIVTWFFRIFVTYFSVFIFWHWIQKSEKFIQFKNNITNKER